MVGAGVGYGLRVWMVYRQAFFSVSVQVGFWIRRRSVLHIMNRYKLAGAKSYYCNYSDP